MRKPILAALAAVLLSAGDAAVRAQDGGPDIDIGGMWIFEMGGGGGTIVMNFGVPLSGVFTVDGHGMSRAHRADFAVSDDSVVTMAFASTGQISGTIPLEDPTRTTSTGSLVISGGTLNATNDRTQLRGTLTVGSTVKKIVLRGTRRLAPEIDLAGGSFDGFVAGRRISSRKLWVRLPQVDYVDDLGLLADQAGFPFFYLLASGPVKVDAAEVPLFGLSGGVFLDSKYRAFGRMATSQFGPAVLTGSLTIDPLTTRPIASFLVQPDSGRPFRVRAQLQAFAPETE